MKFARGIVVVMVFISSNALAQSHQLQKTDSVYRVIKKHIITRDADAIYEMADARLKQSITQGNFRDFLFRDLFSLGPVKKDSLLSFVNNLTATYKIQFQTLTMQLGISLGTDNKLAYFRLEPFKEGPVDKPSLVATTNPLKTIVDKIVDSVARRYIQKSNTVGLSIGIIKDGKISTYNYGETKISNRQLPNNNTIYEIGSITKTFTAAILAHYVNDGKVSLTDPITKYLPDSVAANPALKDITLLNLINHTSGLASLPTNFTAQKPYNEANPYKNYTRQLLFAYLKNCTLKSVPGKNYAYSNLAVGLLGIILENISGKHYDQLVSEIICRPLAMKSTIQHLYPLIIPRFTTVYDEDGHETPTWDMLDTFAAAGSLKSTINDLLIYTKANMIKADNKLSKAFSLTHQVTFNNDTQLSIGLGWHIIKVDGISYYFHNGGTGGSSSFLAYNIERNIAIVILSNATAGTDATGTGILKLLQK
ncbi:serine hydrolase domain-containing protein [Mucilaginibacter sp. UYCu711]|uniref:serine hydrolase domain-containing protein n=1 Tax=Mucilaginibacter sp. UYCu711 TaxID=3156339 RepID=UPI003D19CB77